RIDGLHRDRHRRYYFALGSLRFLCIERKLTSGNWRRRFFVVAQDQDHALLFAMFDCELGMLTAKVKHNSAVWTVTVRVLGYGWRAPRPLLVDRGRLGVLRASTTQHKQRNDQQTRCDNSQELHTITPL